MSIPEFTFDIPQPLQIGLKIDEAIEKIKMKGYNGSKHLIAAHSLGGVMAQDYIKGKSDIF